MISTPETDKIILVGLENADRECVPADFARKLERERDESAAMLGRYKQERDLAEADATNFHARIFELINERDEAREAARRYLSELKNNGH